MIKLRDSSIQILASDGTRHAFELELLQEKLISCCLAAGVTAPWIAEDIALSVEFSLREIGSSNLFTQVEIDSFVLKVLREIGYGEVADHYLDATSNSIGTVAVSEKFIEDAVERYLGLTGDDLKETAGKVCHACLELGMKNIFPTLLLELAKYFHYNQFKRESENIQIVDRLQSGDSVWAVSPDELNKILQKKNSEILTEKIITVSGVSNLFPSIKINISLVSLAKLHGLQKPLTELTIMPYLQTLAEAIDDVANLTLETFIKKECARDLPVYLRFADTAIFSSDWMEGASPADADFIISYIVEMLNTHVVLRT